MKKSFFRIRILFFKLFSLIPYVVGLTALQMGLYYTFKETMLFYIFYPLVYLALEAGLKGESVFYVWYVNIALYYLLAWFFLKKKKLLKAKRYLACPHCKMMVAVFYHWGCGQCHNYQLEESYVTDRCQECGILSNSFFCEHCNEEFKL